ncbi:ssl1498 family light-harvesting-like protein [Tolypothrix sp. PCC 7910]|uniref:photosystem II assembly protein Psb34 n=1 Tax=Tolypothrix sp. PCC 7910 TaxID=2099387 RepID=UPI0014276FE5|nr:ssl1498 family light-harvesting-like protein [Tolypothrix sp. PCC 7910]QIR40879.1 ssl1498 family light-harvesting-like protein [Tolypothrix sp. PCC 7910]
MYTNSNREKILNKYSTEPQIYAAYPDPEKQRRYALKAGFATLLVSALILVSLVLS